MTGRRPILGMIGGAAASITMSGISKAVAQAPPVDSAAFDNKLLSLALDRAASYERLHSLVIARGGQIVVAEAFRGAPIDRPVNVKSVSKTIVAALTGSALDRGDIRDVEASLSSLVPTLLPDDADPRVARLTIADLLTMQAGLERTSGANYGRWVQSADWIRFVLTRPFVAEPGRRMLYSTGSYHVLGAVLAELTGDTLLSLARDRLGSALNIEFPAWTRDPQGYYLGGNNMLLSPLAMVRFGEMYRRRGMWAGTRVLSESWITESWKSRTFSPFSGHDYGFGWFLPEANGHSIAYARGYGGQMIYVAPTLSLTVAVTSDPTRPARSRGYAGDLYDLMANMIVPAAEMA